LIFFKIITNKRETSKMPFCEY